MVHSTEQNSTPAEKKGKASLQENKNKHNPDLLNEIREIKSDMALLKNLSTEGSQIRESNQLSQTAVEQGMSSPGFQNYATHPECPFPGYWPHYNPG